MYDPTGHQPGAVPSRVLTALRGETKRLDVSDGGVSAALLDALKTSLRCDPARERARRLQWERPRSDQGGTSETKRLDASDGAPFLPAPLSPAERAQERAEACLTDLTAVLLARGSDPAAHAQRMAVANHAAAQALLSAYVLWRAEAEAGGHGVPVPALAVSGVSVGSIPRASQDGADLLLGLDGEGTAAEFRVLPGEGLHRAPQGLLHLLERFHPELRIDGAERPSEFVEEGRDQPEAEGVAQVVPTFLRWLHGRLQRECAACQVADAAPIATAERGA